MMNDRTHLASTCALERAWPRKGALMKICAPPPQSGLVAKQVFIRELAPALPTTQAGGAKGDMN